MLIYDYYCNTCDIDFEAFVKVLNESVSCDICGNEADRLTPAPKPLHLRMGVDPTSSSADYWARAREQEIRIQNKDIDPGD